MTDAGFALTLSVSFDPTREATCTEKLPVLGARFTTLSCGLPSPLILAWRVFVTSEERNRRDRPQPPDVETDRQTKPTDASNLFDTMISGSLTIISPIDHLLNAFNTKFEKPVTAMFLKSRLFAVRSEECGNRVEIVTRRNSAEFIVEPRIRLE